MNAAPSPSSVPIPSFGGYRIDGARSTVTFRSRHLFGLGRVRGTFDVADGEIEIAEAVRNSTVRACVFAGSVRTGNGNRDAEARSPRLLDAYSYPMITFTSTGLESAETGWVLLGQLSVRNRSAQVALHIGEATTDGRELRVTATTRIDRYSFGIIGARRVAGRYLEIRLDIVAHALDVR